MTDTIDLLEAIGSDASLRYGQTNELMDVLEEVQVSAKFAKAVVLGDGTPLREGLGFNQMPLINAPGHGDDDGDDDDCDTPQPGRREPGHIPPDPLKKDS
ncbi:MAG: hypothetical protein RSP_10450 [Rhodanobacter sp.]